MRNVKLRSTDREVIATLRLLRDRCEGTTLRDVVDTLLRDERHTLGALSGLIVNLVEGGLLRSDGCACGGSHPPREVDIEASIQ
jgi:hypothetical protein